MDITKLLAFAVEQGASDCHLSSGEPPRVRISGDLKKLDHPVLTQEQVHSMLFDIMNDSHRKDFEKTHDVDFSFSLGDLARFRVNVFMQQHGEAAVFRTIPEKILSLDELGMPRIMKEFCQR
ncbi:MAG: twitching motility protein PilT, partial [Candidatus Binatia bacterium]